MVCKILSHPETLLVEHLSLVRQIGLSKFDQDNIYPECREIIECALFFHDLGKAHPDFQKKIRGEDYHQYPHSAISAQWIYFLLKEKGFSNIDSFIAYMIVYSHHINLKSPREIGAFESSEKEALALDYSYLNIIYAEYLPAKDFFSLDNFRKYSQIYGIMQNINKRDYKQINSEDYLKVNYLFSILIYADKKASIFKKYQESDEQMFQTWTYDLIDKYKIIKFGNSDQENHLNRLREQSYQDSVSMIENLNFPITSVNLPTGMGKTLNVVNLAVKLKNQLRKKRIIYALPFTSIIEQNANVLEDILIMNGIEVNHSKLLKQHHLVDYVYQGQDKWGENESKFLIENWESEFVLTTFFQLLNTLIANENKHLIKLNSLVDSIIILDEVQNIPAKYWLLVNNILKRVAQKFRIHFILSTATMPLIFSKDKKEIVELIDNYQEYFQQVDRIELDCTNISNKIDLDTLADLILNDNYTNASKLIILNSVQASLDLFQKISEAKPKHQVLYLSTNIIPYQRETIIKKVQANSDNIILISTQLVEAGVDIDFDIVYRDLAPLDSIFQACGRCNRNNNRNEKAKVVMFQLINKHGTAYWSFIYDHYLISATLDIIQNRLVSENEFSEISLAYFQRIYKFLDTSDSEELIKCINKIDYNSLKDNQSGFKLIKDIPTACFYITYNKEAENLYQEFQELIETEFDNKFEKSAKIKALRRKMSKYIVTLPKKYAWNNQDKVFVIDKDNLTSYYDSETGFKRNLLQEDWVF